VAGTGARAALRTMIAAPAAEAKASTSTKPRPQRIRRSPKIPRPVQDFGRIGKQIVNF
jgi:hypothetical protein